MNDFREIKIGVIGLGYVGLPIAVSLAKQFKVIGFDINKHRVDELRNNMDSTLEVSPQALKDSNLLVTDEDSLLDEANFYIVTVPTPIDSNNSPNLTHLKSSCQTIGKYLNKNDIVVFESTVYPGVTEEYCLPILESVSGLKSNTDFSLGYSPERINPGDKKNTFENITKVISAQNNNTLDILDYVYSSVVKAGVFRASSIKVAEAAKVIENTQRDLNIALINELALIFNKLKINTNDVLEAAGTKWNFLHFTPGLVGGHCIGVDPYYLTYKSRQAGYYPEVILSGRRINDNMPKRIIEILIKTLISKGYNFKNQSINIYGLTFKENCPDFRNSKVFDIIHELKQYNLNVCVHDPHIKKLSLERAKELHTFSIKSPPPALASILAVPHREYAVLSDKNFNSEIILDIKALYKSTNSITKEIIQI